MNHLSSKQAPVEQSVWVNSSKEGDGWSIKKVHMSLTRWRHMQMLGTLCCSDSPHSKDRWMTRECLTSGIGLGIRRVTLWALSDSDRSFDLRKLRALRKRAGGHRGQVRE